MNSFNHGLYFPPPPGQAGVPPPPSLGSQTTARALEKDGDLVAVGQYQYWTTGPSVSRNLVPTGFEMALPTTSSAADSHELPDQFSPPPFPPPHFTKHEQYAAPDFPPPSYHAPQHDKKSNFGAPKTVANQIQPEPSNSIQPAYAHSNFPQVGDNPCAQGESKDVRSDWIAPGLFVCEQGGQARVLRDCPENVRELDFNTNWYRLPDIRDFLVCSRCFDRHISGTPLTAAFEQVWTKSKFCRFNVPRITKTLLPKCISSGDISSLSRYLNTRVRILDCKGPRGSISAAGSTWFRINSPRLRIMEDFLCCHACYEDFILATDFSSQFVMGGREQLPGEVWICDLHNDYIKRSILAYSGKGLAFDEWANTVAKRLQMPACDGRVEEPFSNKVGRIRPRNHVPDFDICETCYFDRFKFTQLEHEFDYALTSQANNSAWIWYVGTMSLVVYPLIVLGCSDGRKFPIIVLMDMAVRANSIELFCTGVAAVITNPHCTEQGISGGVWYTLIGGSKYHNICEGCHNSLIKSWGLERFYQKSAKSGSSEAIICNMNPQSSTFLPSIHRFVEATETGRWTAYSDFIRTTFSALNISSIQHNIANDRRHIDNAYTEQQLERTMRMLQQQTLQSTQSALMRQAGNEAFLNGIQDSTLSSTYSAVENIQLSAGAVDGYIYGNNSSLGWHPTLAGATGAQLQNRGNEELELANYLNSLSRH